MQTTYDKVVSVCSYCGSGCQIEFTVDKKANRIISAKGAPGRTNEGRLCLKGFYGWDYLNDPQILTRRITSPMIRKGGKGSPLEPVSWDEAIAYAAERLKAIIKEYGPDSVMGAGSARGPGNEAGYITQKFMRAVVGTNNVDHCARICHAASVAGLKQSIGEGAMSVSVPEIEDAEVIFNIGYNGATSHPIVARRIIKAKAKGAKIICADPQISETARIADIHLQQKGGTNLLLLNALAYTIIDEHLTDDEFIKAHVNGYEEFVPKLAKYAPEAVAAEIGVSALAIREAARLYASSKHSVILWGMGITQFSQGVDSVAACSNLALLTGNYGHYATGVGPVRGQNNVQGTCDMGILPATAWGEHDAIYTCCDRGFQRVRKVIEPPEGVKPDWEIQSLLATAMGYPMHYHNTKEIWDEMRKLSPKFTGATYEKIDALGGVQWPCYDESMDDKGTVFLHEGGHFATPDGRGNLIFTDYEPVKEEVDEEYPMSFCTVREVGHYSARTMTGNCRMLAKLEDEPGWVAMNPEDCENLGVVQGDLVRVRSRRGSLITRCLPTERVKPGSTYMTYQWWIGACNELTNTALDPKSKTPEYKYCACRVEKLDDQAEAEAYVQSQYALIRAKMGIEKAGANA